MGVKIYPYLWLTEVWCYVFFFAVVIVFVSVVIVVTFVVVVVIFMVVNVIFICRRCCLHCFCCDFCFVFIHHYLFPLISFFSLIVSRVMDKTSPGNRRVCMNYFISWCSEARFYAIMVAKVVEKQHKTWIMSNMTKLATVYWGLLNDWANWLFYRSFNNI